MRIASAGVAMSRVACRSHMASRSPTSSWFDAASTAMSTSALLADAGGAESGR